MKLGNNFSIDENLIIDFSNKNENINDEINDYDAKIIIIIEKDNIIGTWYYDCDDLYRQCNEPFNRSDVLLTH